MEMFLPGDEGRFHPPAAAAVLASHSPAQIFGSWREYTVEAEGRKVLLHEWISVYAMWWIIILYITNYVLHLHLTGIDQSQVQRVLKWGWRH